MAEDLEDIVKRTRGNLSKMGKSELKIVASDEGLQEIFAQKQVLLIEMNNARRIAADEAARPYLEAINDLDKMYAMLLTMRQ